MINIHTMEDHKKFDELLAKANEFLKELDQLKEELR